MLAAINLLLHNEAEVRRIAARDDVEDAARELARIGARDRQPGAGPIVAVKLGSQGALAIGPDGSLERVPALPVDPVDTTGAGDSFDAGFLRAWLDGATIADALRLGAVCGALSTLGRGGVDAQPTYGEAIAAMALWSSA